MRYIATAICCFLFTATLWADQKVEVPQYTDYTGINKGEPEQKYRNRIIRAYLSKDTFRKRLKTSAYSSFENPTGIYFSRGDEVTVKVSGIQGNPPTLIVHDFDRGGTHDEYKLSEGDNVLSIKNPGLGYLDYRSDTPENAAPIKVSIHGGQINGVFTPQDDRDTWKRLLRDAKCNILDLLGERCQLTYDVESLRKYCPEKGPELLALYDRIIEIEQNDILGWKYDGSHPGNHIHGRVQWGGYMHADGYGGAFNYQTMDGLANPDQLRKNAWGVAHEFGHVNQTRPGMNWGGTTEVTNNICSSAVNYFFTPEETRLEHEESDNADRNYMRGGRFDCFIHSAVVKHQVWQFQAGADHGLHAPLKRLEGGDPFVAVMPFWQLYLYNTKARGNERFLPDIYHDVRVTDESKMTNGQLRMLFIKRACDAAKLNFSQYFLQVGMAAPIDREVDDYGISFSTVTEEMVQEVLDYAARYPEPDSTVICYISANNVEIFRNKLPIEKSPNAPDIQLPIKQVDIPPDAWKNAVAFEAYNGDRLLRVSIRGLNHKDNETTTVVCPPETDILKAVQWDGKRITIARLSDDPGVRRRWEEGIKLNRLFRAIRDKRGKDFKEELVGVDVNAAVGENGNSLMEEAIMRQNLSAVETLLAAGAKLDTLHRADGKTLLHIAAAHDSEEIVNALLKAGADPMVQAGNGAYPIHEAVWYEKPGPLRVLLPYYRKMNFSPDGWGNGYPVTMALSRKNPQLLKEILKAGLDVNDERFAKEPLLTMAVKNNREDMVKLLLKAKARKGTLDAQGKKALDYAKGSIRDLLK